MQETERSALIQAFLATWELFPEPVSLLDRSRTILAINALGRRFGMSIGDKCFSLNPEAHGASCRTCRANEALDRREAVIKPDLFRGQDIQAYWVPLPGHDDCYIHFAIGVKAVAESLAGK